MSLYDILKSAKIGAAPDMLTKLRAQIAPFAKGGYTEKELEAVPPLSFIANGQSLLDWSIDGASGGVGDRTDNLAETVQGGIDATNGLDGRYSDTASQVRTQYIACDENEDYNLTASIFSSQCFISFYDENQNYLSRTTAAALTTNRGFTTPENCKYFRVTLYHATNTEQIYPYTDGAKIMVSKGSTAKTYEPFGYKIPVTCGGETKTIYLDAPLGASDSISMTDTAISIPTVDGSNTLSVGTTVQPSNVYIKYRG